MRSGWRASTIRARFIVPCFSVRIFFLGWAKCRLRYRAWLKLRNITLVAGLANKNYNPRHINVITKRKGLMAVPRALVIRHCVSTNLARTGFSPQLCIEEHGEIFIIQIGETTLSSPRLPLSSYLSLLVA